MQKLPIDCKNPKESTKSSKVWNPTLKNTITKHKIKRTKKSTHKTTLRTQPSNSSLVTSNRTGWRGNKNSQVFIYQPERSREHSYTHSQLQIIDQPLVARLTGGLRSQRAHNAGSTNPNKPHIIRRLSNQKTPCSHSKFKFQNKNSTNANF